MKKLLLGLTLAIFGFCFTSCEYDDDDLWNEVHDLGTKVETLEKASTDCNTNLSALKDIVTALQKQISVNSVTENGNGYDIVFSDGTKASIANGKDGISAPAISVKKDTTDNQYYWTLDDEWMTVSGNKVRASASTPQVRINETSKEWEITSDGTNWTSTGITAEGKDGDAFFSSVKVENSEVSFTLSDGTTFTIPMSSGVTLTLKTQLLSTTGTNTLSYESEKMSFVTLDQVPAGIKAVLDENTKTVSVTVTDAAAFKNGSRLIIKGADQNGYVKMAAAALFLEVDQADFLVVNEGWFGHESGSVNAYYQGNWNLRIFQSQNPGKTFGSTSTVGVQNDNRTYFISKDSPQVIEVETGTLKELSSINFERGEQAMNFVAFDAKKGYLTTDKAVYEVSLDPLVVGKKVYESGAGDIFNADGKIYFISGGKAYCYDPATTTTTELGAAAIGFARAGEYLYAGNKDNLLKIKLSDNTFSNITTDCNLSWNKWAYTPSSLCTSKDSKFIYFTTADAVKKYDVTAGTISELWKQPAGNEFYGGQISVNPKDGNIYAISKKAGWGENGKIVDIVIIDKETGATLKTIKYTDVENTYWFPSQIVFIQ